MSRARHGSVEHGMSRPGRSGDRGSRRRCRGRAWQAAEPVDPCSPGGGLLGRCGVPKPVIFVLDPVESDADLERRGLSCGPAGSRWRRGAMPGPARWPSRTEARSGRARGRRAAGDAAPCTCCCRPRSSPGARPASSWSGRCCWPPRRAPGDRRWLSLSPDTFAPLAASRSDQLGLAEPGGHHPGLRVRRQPAPDARPAHRAGPGS